MKDYLKEIYSDVLYNMAKDSFINNEFEKAKDYLEIVNANDDNITALTNLGVVYERLGIFDMAKNCYVKGVKLHDSTAVLNLAIIYHLGNGVEKNYYKAIELYNSIKKDETVSDNAYQQLYFCYIELNDEKRAFNVLLESFNTMGAKNKIATTLLALCYEKGIGTKEDLEQAMHYYLLASGEGGIEASYHAALLYSDKKNPFYNLTKAIKLFLNLDEIGSLDASYNIALIYLNNDNSGNYKEIVYYYLTKSIKNGSKDGYLMLAKELYTGEYLSEDKNTALELLFELYESTNIEEKNDILKEILKIDVDFEMRLYN